MFKLNNNGYILVTNQKQKQMQENPIDNLSKFGITFQQKCISSLLSDKTFIEQIVDILDEHYFDNDAHQWIVIQIKDFFFKYKQLITLEAFKVKVENLESPILKMEIIQQLKLIYIKIKDQDIVYIKEQFLEFCRNQKLKTAIVESIDLLKVGQYEKIKHLVDEALKAGIEKNLGHDYHEDFEQRMTQTLRKCVQTKWEVIDKLLDGGLGIGELGVLVAPSGKGKCIGGNSEIIIQYEKIGFQIDDKITLWFNPFDKIEINDNFRYIYEIEKLLNSIVEIAGAGKIT